MDESQEMEVFSNLGDPHKCYFDRIFNLEMGPEPTRPKLTFHPR